LTRLNVLPTLMGQHTWQFQFHGSKSDFSVVSCLEQACWPLVQEDV